MPRRWGKELELAQSHPPAFHEALLIDRGEALQLGRRDPRSNEWIWHSKHGLPDALEERSLHRKIEPRHERLQVGVELAEGVIALVPGPARQKAEGSPIMRLQLRGQRSR